MERWTTYALLVAGMAIFGSGTPVSKIVTEAFPVYLASGARMVLAAVALLPILLLSGRIRRIQSISRGDWGRLAAIALVGMFGFSILMLYGMKEVSGAVGGIVMATTPAVTAAGSVLFLRERLDRWTALSIGLAVGGLMAVNLGSSSGGNGDHVVLGSALVFGAVCGEAAYTLIGKRLTANLGVLEIATIAAVLASALFLPLAIIDLAGFNPGEVEIDEWVALAWWGLGTMALGSVLWYFGVSRTTGGTASAFMAVMPVSALLLSYLLLGEAFEPIHAVGMAIVLGGIGAIAWRDHSEGSG